MFPSTIKKSVMPVQLSHSMVAPCPLEKAYSNGACITVEHPGLYKTA